jgi:hypothetical protein
MNRLSFIFLVIFILFCQTTQDLIKPIEKKQDDNNPKITIQEDNEKKELEKQKENQEQKNSDKLEVNSQQKKEKIEPSKDPTTIAMTDTQTNSQENTVEIIKPEIIKPTEEDKMIISNFKNEHQKEEELYKKDSYVFFNNKNYLLSFKDISRNEEVQFEEYKISYLTNLEKKKKSQLEILNRIDPERNAFYRKEVNESFQENIILHVKEDSNYSICEIFEPYLYLYHNELNCKNKIYTINRKILENKNYFEEISIFEILPKRKGFYLIIQEINNKKEVLKLYDLKNQEYQLSYLETDGENLIKLYTYQILKYDNTKRIYFKIISPLSILFRISE